MDRIKRENITIVLVEPQIPENIGSVARAMNNMDIQRLILVNPKSIEQDRILKTATVHSRIIIETMEVYDDIREALGSFRFIAGTTARIGAMRPAMSNPRSLAMDLIPISQKNSIAILFGPEDKGLSNEHLRYCHTLVRVPTFKFSSLNLSQAVMIICYEIFINSVPTNKRDIPRFANNFELEGMYDHLKSVLMKIGYLNPQNPERWMLNVRRLFSRYRLRAREASVIRGICRQVDWYTSQASRAEGRGSSEKK